MIFFLNCDLLELQIQDSYKELYCDYVFFLFLRLCFRVLQFLQYSSFVVNLHDVFFSKKIMVCMMYTFLNRPVYTRRIKLGKQKNTFSSILHQPNNFWVNPTCSIENKVKGFRLTRFFLNEILQMSKFKLFVSRDKFSRIAQIFLKFANGEHD